MQEQRRPGFAAGRLIVYNRESHLDVYGPDTLRVGDVFEVVRGNGPARGHPHRYREGHRV
jgi:hypothetical protein